MLVAANLSFAKRLKKLRRKAGLSQYALAKLSGFSRQTISSLEKGGREPSWETVRRLARTLGVKVQDFDDEAETPGEGTAEAEGQDEPTTTKRPRRRGNNS